MPYVSRYEPRIDILREARNQDSSRAEEAQIDLYRINGIKPQPELDFSDPLVEDDPLSGSFNEIIEQRKRSAYQIAKRKNDPLLDKCFEIDIEQWDELMDQYIGSINDTLFGLEVD